MPRNGIVKVGIDEGRKLDVTRPAGAEITMIMDGETQSTTHLSENVTRVKPGVTLEPVHSHRDIEEIVYVLEGQGRAWIDGSTCKIKTGDSVLYPPNSKHTVTNTGTGTLVLLCFFSTSEYRKPGAYLTHEGEDATRTQR